MRMRWLYVVVLLFSYPVSAQIDAFVEMCTAPNLEEPLLRSINSLFKNLNISEVRNETSCKTAGSSLEEKSEISFAKHEILTLEPLKFFPNLRHIFFDGSPNLDANTFKFVPQLERLTFLKCTLTNFEFLTHFNHLRRLTLGMATTTEANLPAAGLVNLKQIFLGKLVPSDWNVFAVATKLEEASFSYFGAPPAEIRGDWLQYLPQLLSLNLTNAKMSADIKASLSRLTKLKVLSLIDVDIGNIEFIKSTTQLEHLALQNADLQALPLMNHLKNLTNLNVSGNNLTSLEPLRDMLSIEYLSFQGNSISNLEPISGLSKLRFLYMSKNKVDRVSPIATLLDLESLFASHNCIEDFPVLRRLRASHRNSQDQIIALNVNGDVGQPEVCE